MKRFDAHIRAINESLQERPEILQLARVNCAVNIHFRMVDDFVGVIGIRAFVGVKRVSVQRRSRCDLAANLSLASILCLAI